MTLDATRTLGKGPVRLGGCAKDHPRDPVTDLDVLDIGSYGDDGSRPVRSHHG